MESGGEVLCLTQNENLVFGQSKLVCARDGCNNSCHDFNPFCVDHSLTCWCGNPCAGNYCLEQHCMKEGCIKSCEPPNIFCEEHVQKCWCGNVGLYDFCCGKHCSQEGCFAPCNSHLVFCEEHDVNCWCGKSEDECSELGHCSVGGCMEISSDGIFCDGHRYEE